MTDRRSTAAVLGAWRPLGAPARMPRAVFWPVFAPLCLLGALLGGWLLGEPHAWAVAALCAWTLLFLVALCPAVVRRGRDAGIGRPVMCLVLAPVLFAAACAVFVPAIALDGDGNATAAAVYFILVTYPLCMLPTVVFALLPSKRR